jgi:hypothetical protein
MKARIAYALALIAIVVVAAASPGAAAIPGPLANVLRSLNNLTDGEFRSVVRWAHYGVPSPDMRFSSERNVEAAIMALGTPNRNAVLAWLKGQGRQALYNRGATDAEIGSYQPVNMQPAPAAPPPTPNPFRLLQFASSGLSNSVADGRIAILGGFAAVRNDGTRALVCISFKNTAGLVANRVVFDFPVMSHAGGHVLATMQLDRRGEFSPGIDINGWASLSDWQSAMGHKGYNDNCAGVNPGVAAMPLLQARIATYNVMRIEYEGGKIWTAP